MSGTAIIWGLITGTWFGSETISQLPFLKFFVVDKIYSFNPESSAFIMQLSFIIGVVQLSIGHLMTAFKKINSLTALAEIGWVLVLWAVYFIANNIVLGTEMAGATMPLFISGVVLILLFANFQKQVAFPSIESASAYIQQNMLKSEFTKLMKTLTTDAHILNYATQLRVEKTELVESALKQSLVLVNVLATKFDVIVDFIDYFITNVTEEQILAFDGKDTKEAFVQIFKNAGFLPYFKSLFN